MPLPRLIPIEELFADPVFSGASISSDGERIAYLAPRYGRTQVWVRGIDQEHEDAVCVTHDKRRGIKSYYWTDDPRWLLYLQDTDGNEDWHLYRVDLKDPDAPAVDLTPMPVGSRVSSVEASKSVPGTVLVSMNKRPLNFDTFRIDVATGETTVLIEQPEMTSGVIAHDGEPLYYMHMDEEGTYNFFALDAETGERTLLHAASGVDHPLGVTPCQPTHDGTGLLLGIFAEGSDDLSLVRVDRTTGQKTVVAAVAGHDLCTMGYHGPRWAPCLYTDRATGELIAARFVGDRPIITPLNKEFTEVFDELSKLSDGVIGGLSSDKGGRRWVVSFVHDTEPGLTYLYDHATRESRLLFRPYPQLDAAELARMEAIHFTARDGLPITAFLTLPTGVDPSGVPLVLKVHGGPWAHDTWTFDRDAQFFANRGIATLQVNFRGSTGSGAAHIRAGIHEWAGKMHDDLIDACDWTVKQGIADPSRLAIFGGSYGGYASLVGVTFTPDYFAAAVNYVGISNLANFMGKQPPVFRPGQLNCFHRHIGDPENPEQLPDLLARSPITHVDKIQTPLLVVHGAMDVRVVREEADLLVEALRARDVPVEYLLAEDEGHGFQNPDNVMTLFRTMERFFAKHLGSRSEVSV
jgi:dipeptidyl aminopeptidase/acylaminoacyl peptidase